MLTSDIRDAVKSQMPLYRWMGNPSVLQLRARWTSLLLPDAQIVAMPAGCHPYCRASASLNAPLCRVNLCSSIGRVFNYASAPVLEQLLAVWFLEMPSLFPPLCCHWCACFSGVHIFELDFVQLQSLWCSIETLFALMQFLFP